jgi:hypothetical protein
MHCQYMCSLRSFLGAPFCSFCVILATALAERVVLLDDSFVAFENSRASVEVNLPSFVLGGNLPIQSRRCDILPLSRRSRDVSPCHFLSYIDDFSFAMDVEVVLPSGNIGDEPEACGNILEGFTCAAPEYAGLGENLCVWGVLVRNTLACWNGLACILADMCFARELLKYNNVRVTRP